MNEAPTPQSFDPATAWANPPGIERALTIGVVIGVAISFFGVGGAFLAGGQGFGASIGMGAFVAFWGGLGFGGMIGGVVWATQVEEAAKLDRLAAGAASRTQPEPSDPPSTITALHDAAGVSSPDPEPAAVKVAS